MAQAYIVAATRTAGGKRGGKLSGWHPADLAAQVLDELVRRSQADPAQVEDVIMGCVSQVGQQATNVARNAVLASSLPESVPGTTVDRQCGSSQQALHFAAQAVMSGSMDMVIAAGVESMSRVPMGTRDMLSTPAAITMSMLPDITAWAAKCRACWDDPHCRSTVVPGTDSGRDEASTALRATFVACWPTWLTQPMITSSTWAGSAWLRRTSSSSTWAARSAGCQPESFPPRLPPAVRVAATMYACAMDMSPVPVFLGGMVARPARAGHRRKRRFRPGKTRGRCLPWCLGGTPSAAPCGWRRPGARTRR